MYEYTTKLNLFSFCLKQQRECFISSLYELTSLPVSDWSRQLSQHISITVSPWGAPFHSLTRSILSTSLLWSLGACVQRESNLSESYVSNLLY